MEKKSAFDTYEQRYEEIVPRDTKRAKIAPPRSGSGQAARRGRHADRASTLGNRAIKKRCVTPPVCAGGLTPRPARNHLGPIGAPGRKRFGHIGSIAGARTRTRFPAFMSEQACRPAERKFITFFPLVTINFLFFAQLPQNKVGVPRPPDSDPLT